MPTVCVERQPTSWPFTMAYTASMSEVVTVTAPATSSFAPLAVPGRCGSSRRHERYTSEPIGTLTRKIQCQLSVVVRKPPSNTPMLPPAEHTKP